MPAPLLQMSDIRLTFGGAPLFERASLSVGLRERVALVGRNGSGKSTLLKIAAGLVEPDSGLRFADPGAAIAYLPQEPDFGAFATAGDYARAGLPPGEDPHGVSRLLEELELAPETPTATMSGGEARRAALVRVLAGDPDVLLLDEPTNHLDLPAIAWLEERLAASRAGVVVISHDRRFLENLTKRTVWLDRGLSKDLDRGFRDFEAWRDKVLEDEETQAHKLDRKIVAEEHWVRYGVTARRKRNMRRMGLLADMRRERREARRATGVVKFSVAEGAVSGKRVIVAEKIGKAFDGRAVVSDFSIEIGRGDRIGFVGPNGAGKTTLLRLLTGALAPDEGRVVVGAGVALLSLDQRRAALDPAMRVADAINDGRGDWVEINGEKRHVASYLKDFLFAPEQFKAPVSALSGGERGRLALAAALARPSNLLVLDEPTNDLDLETLDLLEETLADYPGTLLVVSHDRAFLDRVATSIVAPAPEGLGRWTEYVGGYDDMLAQRGAAPATTQKAPTSARPQPAAERSKARAEKLSFKEQHALKTLPTRMETLQTSIAALKARLADPGLFARDAAAFGAAATELSDAERALAAAEDEWLALEMKREALEG